MSIKLNSHYVINGSNLYGGGGLQVATSFISDLTLNHVNKCSCIHLCISKALYENLMSINVDLSVFASVLKLDFSFRNIIVISKYLSQFKVVFTIFGPAYLFMLGNTKHVCGFAQPWICFKEHAKDIDISYAERCWLRLKFFIQKRFFETADLLVVESSAVRAGLLDDCGFKSEIDVVSNCVAESLYKNSKFTLKEAFRRGAPSSINLGYIGRAYKHKNLEVLKPVIDILIERYKLDVRLYTTLSEEEMDQTGLRNFANIKNLGPIKSGSLKSFYSKIDFLIFPSLLECFSVSPLEAMSQSVIVLASDRPFIRASCLEHAVYFDPLDIEKMAKKIFETINNKEALPARAKNAYKYVMGRPSNKDRTRAYLNFLEPGWCSDD